MKKKSEPLDTRGLTELEALAPSIAIALEMLTPKGWGFSVSWFQENDQGGAHFISNLGRADLITALREMADILELEEDCAPGLIGRVN